MSSTTVYRQLTEVDDMVRILVKKQLSNVAMKKKWYDWALKFSDLSFENWTKV